MVAEDWPIDQDWREWVPDAPEPSIEALLTREEILALLNVSASVKKSDLRFWEYSGVLPRPVRRRKDGATRALYPLWYATLIRRLRAFQKQGFRLEELPPRMRAEAQQLAQSPSQQIDHGGRFPARLIGTGKPGSALAEWGVDLQRYAIDYEATPRGHPFAHFEPPPTLAGELRRTLVDIAVLLRSVDGIAVEDVEIALKDRHGRAVPYHLSIGPEVEQWVEALRQVRAATTSDTLTQ